MSVKTGATFTLSSAGFSGVFTVIVTSTKDFDQAITAAALAGREGFKWCAISGTLIGGLSKAYALRNTVNTTADIPSWQQSEIDVRNQYGGSEQVTYLGGKEVPVSTSGAIRLDVVQVVGDYLEAIEVKNYNLNSPTSLSTPYSVLEREVGSRVANCPPCTTQRIVLSVRGKNFRQEKISSVIKTIGTRLINIYPNIPIDVLAA